MSEDNPHPAKPHYRESPQLAFWGSHLHIDGDPVAQEQFSITLHCLENMTAYLTEFALWPELEPQTVKDELTYFNQTVAALCQEAGSAEPEGEITLAQLHALSLRRLLAAYETNGTSQSDYERFAHLHTVIFLALQEEREVERLMQASQERYLDDDELPF